MLSFRCHMNKNEKWLLRGMIDRCYTVSVTARYTPVHFVLAVGNCRLCMRHCLACISYARVVHCALVVTHMLHYDASAKH